MWEERPGEAKELNGIWWQGRPGRASRTFGMLVFILTENYSEGLKEMPKPLTHRVPTLACPRFEMRNCSHQNLCIHRKIKTSGLSERNPGQQQTSKQNRSWQNTAKRKEELFPLQSKDQQWTIGKGGREGADVRAPVMSYKSQEDAISSPCSNWGARSTDQTTATSPICPQVLCFDLHRLSADLSGSPTNYQLLC